MSIIRRDSHNNNDVRPALDSFCRCIVIKIGSAVLLHDDGFSQDAFRNLVQGVVEIRKRGIKVVVVCSGAVALGMERLELNKRPDNLSAVQAVASVGQGILAHKWSEELSHMNVSTAQILLTHDDLHDRRRFISARNTLRALINMDTVPIINENDAVAVDEIKMGDNDILASIVVSLVDADHLIICSSVEGLLTFEDGHEPRLISRVGEIDVGIRRVVTQEKSSVGSGGMGTKLEAIHRVNKLGVSGQIVNGSLPGILLDCASGKMVGTWFDAHEIRMNARRHWIAYAKKSTGRVSVDQGAEEALRHQGKSLLPIGVTEIFGDFQEGDMIEICDSKHRLLAVGLASLNAEDSRKTIGLSSSQIKHIFGWHSVMVHRDDLVLVESSDFLLTH